MHAEKYRAENESFSEAMSRVASTLTKHDGDFHHLREILMSMRFMPGGRIQAAIGSSKRVTAYNCFVSGPIEDSFVEGDGSIMQRATEAATTMRMGGGIGYDFSTLRPRGDRIKRLGSRSSGPVSFMEIYDAVCRCTASSGHRRGAQMGVMRIDHPDIEEFIRAKQNTDRLTGFNVSVAVTDEFMEALACGKSFWLRFGGQNYREVDPAAIWDALMRASWDWAEPGVLFIDTINRMNNLWYCESIAATNPCGEQPLPPFGACLLGSFNLPKYLTAGMGMDWDLLADDIRHVVGAMDRVVDVAIYPMAAQEKEAHSKRRMGLGVTGLANCVEAMTGGYGYGSDDFVAVQEKILRFINRHAYLTSVELAKKRGPFPLFDSERYVLSQFVQTLDEDVQDAIRAHGIRNSHLTSIAPTGTISLCADNVSSGIEPVFAESYVRTIQTFEGPKEVTVRDYGLQFLSVLGKTAKDVTVDEHLAVLLCAARNVDSAVSKTCNVPSSTSWEDFKEIYRRAWAGGAKGCTTFQRGGKRFGVLNAQEEGMACKVDPESGRRSCE